MRRINNFSVVSGNMLEAVRKTAWDVDLMKIDTFLKKIHKFSLKSDNLNYLLMFKNCHGYSREARS